MKKYMRKTKRRRSGVRTRKRGGNPIHSQNLENVKISVQKQLNKRETKYKQLSEWEEMVMKKQFNTVNKVIKELQRMTSEYCADSEMKKDADSEIETDLIKERKNQCKIKINALKIWLDELVEKTPPSFKPMNIQTMSPEEWQVEDLEKEIRDLSTVIRKKRLVLNTHSNKSNENETNAIKNKNKLNRLQNMHKIAVTALEDKRKANRAVSTYKAENYAKQSPPPRGSFALKSANALQGPNYNENVPYSPTIYNGHIRHPSVNRSVNKSGTRHLTVWLPINKSLSSNYDASSASNLSKPTSYRNIPNTPIIFNEYNKKKLEEARREANAWLKRMNPTI